MDSAAFEAISQVSPIYILLIIFGVLYVFKQSVTWIQYVMNTFGLVREEDLEKKEIVDSVTGLTNSMSKLDKSINERFDYLSNDIYKRMDKMQDDIDNVRNASREELADKINLKFKKYFQQGYIPFDEYDDFIKLHDAYNGVGGNHSGDQRFEKCIHMLQIIDDSTEEMKLRFLDSCIVESPLPDGEKQIDK